MEPIYINNLPNEILSLILSNIELFDRIRLAFVSHKFHICMIDSEITKEFVRKFRNYRFERFIEKYIDKVNWAGLSSNLSLCPEFFEKHITPFSLNNGTLL